MFVVVAIVAHGDFGLNEAHRKRRLVYLSNFTSRQGTLRMVHFGALGSGLNTI